MEASLDAKIEGGCCLVATGEECAHAEKEQFCCLEKAHCSAAKECCCFGQTSTATTNSESQNCCTKIETHTDTVSVLGASSCKFGSPGGLECLGNACCDGSGISLDEETRQFDKINRKVPASLDIEKSTAILEHIILSVQGLTCVGCEKKLARALAGIPGTYNVHTSLVLSRAEFDFDSTAGPLFEVIKTLERNTGFLCQQLNSNYMQEVDVLLQGRTKDLVDLEHPDGVFEMKVVNRQTVRIVYDAKIIGARDLLRNSFGHPLKLAAPQGSSELESGIRHIRHTARITLLSALLTIPVLVLAWAPLPPQPNIYGGVSLALATIVQFVIVGPFYSTALRALIYTRVMEMDLLIVLSTSAAYIVSVTSFAFQMLRRPLPTGEFFETSTLLVTLIMIGRLVSAIARHRAVESVSIRALQVEKVILCNVNGYGDEEIDARLLQYGDLFKVKPDSRITTDGVIVFGRTEVDESMVTGECLPVEKSVGSSVNAGSLNGSGVIIVSLARLLNHNMISKIADMVDEAKFTKPKAQELVDRVASYFIPMVLTLTTITFTVWIAIGAFVRHQSIQVAVVNAITYAISVLVVSCPCAIGLAIPMVIVISGGVAAKHGVVFKTARATESAHNVSHVVFDKTGTLTRGSLCVVEEVCFSRGQSFAASLALALTNDSKHPVSVAISKHLGGQDFSTFKVENWRSVIGKGVEGIFEGEPVRCGNAAWLSATGIPEVRALLAKSLTVFCLAINGEVIAAYGLQDSLRPEALPIVAELQKRGIVVSILSGDDVDAVNAAALELGISTTHVRARCSPGEKQDYIKDLKADKKQTVMFCGDGTNDAVALAEADIGVHITGGSSDLAQTAAAVVLTRPHLGGILVLLDLSRAAHRRILFNFAWSFAYNLVAISLAAGVFVIARIPPQYAGLGEIVSVLPVILVALHLRWYKMEEY